MYTRAKITPPTNCLYYMYKGSELNVRISQRRDPRRSPLHQTNSFQRYVIVWKRLDILQRSTSCASAKS